MRVDGRRQPRLVTRVVLGDGGVEHPGFALGSHTKEV
jgi:hypothetical protein